MLSSPSSSYSSASSSSSSSSYSSSSSDSSTCSTFYSRTSPPSIQESDNSVQVKATSEPQSLTLIRSARASSTRTEIENRKRKYTELTQQKIDEYDRQGTPQDNYSTKDIDERRAAATTITKALHAGKKESIFPLKDLPSSRNLPVPLTHPIAKRRKAEQQQSQIETAYTQAHTHLHSPSGCIGHRPVSPRVPYPCKLDMKNKNHNHPRTNKNTDINMSTPRPHDKIYPYHCKHMFIPVTPPKKMSNSKSYKNNREPQAFELYQKDQQEQQQAQKTTGKGKFTAIFQARKAPSLSSFLSKSNKRNHNSLDNNQKQNRLEMIHQTQSRRRMKRRFRQTIPLQIRAKLPHTIPLPGSKNKTLTILRGLPSPIVRIRRQ